LTILRPRDGEVVDGLVLRVEGRYAGSGRVLVGDREASMTEEGSWFIDRWFLRRGENQIEVRLVGQDDRVLAVRRVSVRSRGVLSGTFWSLKLDLRNEQRWEYRDPAEEPRDGETPPAPAVTGRISESAAARIELDGIYIPEDLPADSRFSRVPFATFPGLTRARYTWLEYSYDEETRSPDGAASVVHLSQVEPVQAGAVELTPDYSHLDRRRDEAVLALGLRTEPLVFGRGEQRLRCPGTPGVRRAVRARGLPDIFRFPRLEIVWVDEDGSELPILCEAPPGPRWRLPPTQPLFGRRSIAAGITFKSARAKPGAPPTYRVRGGASWPIRCDPGERSTMRVRGTGRITQSGELRLTDQVRVDIDLIGDPEDRDEEPVFPWEPGGRYWTRLVLHPLHPTTPPGEDSVRLLRWDETLGRLFFEGKPISSPQRFPPDGTVELQVMIDLEGRGRKKPFEVTVYWATEGGRVVHQGVHDTVRFPLFPARGSADRAAAPAH
jgi:hypothetical protein